MELKDMDDNHGMGVPGTVPEPGRRQASSSVKIKLPDPNTSGQGKKPRGLRHRGLIVEMRWNETRDGRQVGWMSWLVSAAARLTLALVDARLACCISRSIKGASQNS